MQSAMYVYNPLIGILCSVCTQCAMSLYYIVCSVSTYVVVFWLAFIIIFNNTLRSIKMCQ